MDEINARNASSNKITMYRNISRGGEKKRCTKESKKKALNFGFDRLRNDDLSRNKTKKKENVFLYKSLDVDRKSQIRIQFALLLEYHHYHHHSGTRPVSTAREAREGWEEEGGCRERRR